MKVAILLRRRASIGEIGAPRVQPSAKVFEKG
jgi:hypothetical protein